LFPDEIYISHEINRVLGYSSDNRDKLVDHDGLERSAQEIAHSYYANVDDCFKTTDNKSVAYQSSIRYNFLISDHISKEYCYTHQNDIQLQINCETYEKNLPIKAEQAIKLFVRPVSNNFLYSKGDELQSCRVDDTKAHNIKDLDSDISITDPSSMDHHNSNSHVSESNQPLSISNSQIRRAASTAANATATTTTNLSQVSQPAMEAITQFFYDEPYLPYHSPPPHGLEDSPCKSIIRFDSHSSLYNCALHPDVQSYHLESIEHHIKFKNPDMHKSEILKQLIAYVSEDELES
jgi:hypothetical protein